MKRKSVLSILLSAMLIFGSLTGCSSQTATVAEESKAASDTEASSAKENLSESKQAEGEHLLELSDAEITVNGETADESSEKAVYLSNDIIYYEDKETYESGNPYGEGTAEERHSADDAAAHTVVNITEAGIYRVTGTLTKGQIRIDLGEDANENPEAVVTLILDNANIQCDVAPAVIFMNVYECDNEWTAETASSDVSTETAGANLIIADDSTNNVTGSHVARIFKDNDEEKKLWKQDGALYSYMSMNVDGEEKGNGILNLTADNEGLDTELHLTINGGNINIRSGNDGINTNEDGVSVTTINGGNIHIIAGLGEEGDGIDSNGWLVINGGTVIASANPAADAGLDSDMGSYVNGGTVVALGSTMDWAESDSEQVTMNLQFAGYQASDSAIVVKDMEENIVFAYDPSMDEVVGENIRKYMGAIVSCPDFALEETYQVYIGGELEGTENTGVYDVTGITAYEGGIQQSYTGTDVTMRPMGGMGGPGFGGGRPGMDGGERPEMPEGGRADGERPEMPEGGWADGERPEIPEGWDGRERPEMPEGGWADGERPDVPEGELADSKNGNSLFYMQDKVNCFSGVAGME